MDPRFENKLNITRRHFLRDGSLGLGGLALGVLSARPQATRAETNAFAVKPTHYAPKAKNVIYLHMAGSPPHLDMFDYKPELLKRNGQECPAETLKGKRFAFTSGVP